MGIGKTHLLHAVANYVMEHSPDLRVMYMTAEDFMNEMMKAIRNQSMDDFREKLRKTIDILLLDDIQFLIGKNTAQTELFIRLTLFSMLENRWSYALTELQKNYRLLIQG